MRAALRLIGRTLLGLVCLTALLGAVVYGVQAWRLDVDAWHAAEPCRVTVDLSREGRYEAPFHQEYAGSHSEWLVLEVEPPFASPEEAQDAPEGLALKVWLEDDDGEAFETEATAADLLTLAGWGTAPWPALKIAPLARGDYRLELEVLALAKGLAGRKQQIVARYELCGLEGLIDTGLTGAAVVCSVVALAGGRWLWAIIRRSRRRAQAEPAPAPQA